MADGCVQTPTLTRTNVVTSESVFTTTSVSTSIFPASFSTSIFSTCTQTNSSVPCISTQTSSVFTLPGSTSLTTLELTRTSEVPITSFTTLFGTTCTSSSSSTTPTSTTPTSTSTPSATTPTGTPSTTPPPNTPPANSVSNSGSTDISKSSSSTSSSSTGTSFSSSSAIVPPTFSTTHSETAGGTLQTDPSNHGSKKSSNTGPIVGGVLGGLVALVVVAFLTWKYVKKNRRFDDIFDPVAQPKPHYQKASKISKDPEPKPYTYGLVGQNTTNPIGMSPPSSPPPGQSSFNNIGHQPGNDIGPQGQGSNGIGQNPGGSNGIGQNPGGNNGIGPQSGNNMGYPQGNDIGMQPNHAPAQHIRNPSLTPLLAGAGAALATATAASSRPSSADSSLPLGPLVTHAPQAQGYPPMPHSTSSTSSYPPALQNWNNTQGYAPQQQQQQQGGYASSSQGYGPASAMAGPSSSSAASNPLSLGGGSINSLGSASTAPSSWGGGGPSSSGGGAGAGGTVYNPALPTMVPLIAASGASAARNTSYGSGSNNRVSTLQQYEDPFARTGSPVSIQEPRILQVTNAEPGSLDEGLYDPAVYYAAGTGTGTSAAASGSGSSAGAGAAGSGRPLSARAEKAALVHLDGGLYQTPAPGTPSAAPGPPAYTES